MLRQTLRLARLFRPDQPRIILAVVILVLNLGAGLLKPWPLAVIIDSVLGERAFPDWFAGWTGAWGKEQWLVALSLVVLCLYAAHSLLNTLQNYLIIKTGLHGLERLRNVLFHWMQRMSVRFYQGARQGDLIYRASWDTYSIQVLFQQGFLGLLAPLLSLSLMLLVMGQLSIALTLVAMSSLPVLLVSMRFFGRQMSQRSLEAHQADSQLTSFVQQTISALALIQSCTQEQHEERRFAQHAGSSFRGRLAQHGWEVAYLAVVGILFGIMVAAIVWIGAGQVGARVITVGQLTIFLAYLAQFYDPLNQLSHLGTTVSDASAGVKRVFEILDTPEEIIEAPQARAIIRRTEAWHPFHESTPGPPDVPAGSLGPLDFRGSCDRGTGRAPQGSRSVCRSFGDLGTLNEHESQGKEAVMAQSPLVVQGAIEFDQVVFGYQPDRAVLRGLSFSLEAGASLAIVGPSGAGKSTLLHLMVRFFDPDAGCIKLDGADLRSLKLADLRSQMTYMMQEPLLLPGTVVDNVGFGCAEPTIERVVRACMAAHADEFIRRLPQQYETVIGDGAIRLSAGEKQRLNLARAFLRETPLLLLDEPTSALDAESENLVVNSLHQWMPGHTALIVTHRPPLVKLVKRVLRLESDGAAHYE